MKECVNKVKASINEKQGNQRKNPFFSSSSFPNSLAEVFSVFSICQKIPSPGTSSTISLVFISDVAHRFVFSHSCQAVNPYLALHCYTDRQATNQKLLPSLSSFSLPRSSTLKVLD